VHVVNRTAYVITFFRPAAGGPQFVGAGIFSESAQNITLEPNAIAEDVLSYTGIDYEDARANAMTMCARDLRWCWLLPHLKD
jgi:hypothetical protein